MAGVGNQPQRNIIEMAEPMDWDCVINPEAIMDCNAEFQNALCVKMKVNTPPISDTGFVDLVNRLDPTEAFIKKDRIRYGGVTSVIQNTLTFTKGKLLDSRGPFRADASVADPTKVSLYQEYGLEHLRQMRGVLPGLFPGWQGVSCPYGSVFGVGSGIGLCQEDRKLGYFQYLAKGTQRWVIIPREKTATINSWIRVFLHAKGCPATVTSCPYFLNHGKFVFEEDFLIKNFQAEAFDLQAGQVVLVNAGVYFQVKATSQGLAASSNFIPRKWLEMDPFDACTDAHTDITRNDVLNMKRIAINTKDYAGSLMKLASKRIGNPDEITLMNMEIPPPVIQEVVDLTTDD